jgi:hypothetical protein
MEKPAPPSIVTLHQIVTDRIKEKGITRHNLILQMGYSNVSKGIRKLDAFTYSLKPPGDDFINRLLTVLEIDCPTFIEGYQVTHEEIIQKLKYTFKPSIRININFIPTPWFTAQLVYRQCEIKVPSNIQELPFDQEIKSINELFKNKLDDLPFKKRLSGFHISEKSIASLFLIIN